MHLAHYIDVLLSSERELRNAYTEVGARRNEEPDVRVDSEKFARRCDAHVAALEPLRDRVDGDHTEPATLRRALFAGPREGPLGLLRDLHDLYLMACECDLAATLVTQASQGLREPQLSGVAQQCQADAALQMAWLRSRMKQAAPQALIVA